MPSSGDLDGASESRALIGYNPAMDWIRNRVLEGRHGRPMLLDVAFPEQGRFSPIIVFSHGFKGFKDWGPWNPVAETFASEGFVFVKFNFAFNGGTVEQPIDFPDLDAFGRNTFSRELDDLEVVLDWIESAEDFEDRADRQQIALLGHSRGGALSILKAREDSRVRQLVTWGAVADFEPRLPQGEELEQWEREGVHWILNSRTGQNMPLYFGLYEDFLAHRSRLDVPSAARQIEVPFLIVHGSDDETVAPDDAHYLHELCEHSQLNLIEGADHTFGAGHPFEEDELPTPLWTAIDHTVTFLDTTA